MNIQTPSSNPRTNPRSTRASQALLIAMLAAGATTSVFAASQTWSATPTDSNWVTTTNWSGGAAPGALNANTTDIATFNSALSSGIGGSGNPIVIDSTRNIGGITFDTANVGAFQIGTNAGNILRVGSNSTSSTMGIKITSTANNSQVIAAPLQIGGYVSSQNIQYTFSNDSSNNSVTLSFTGPITANISASRPSKLILSGNNTGTNIISGNISQPSFAQQVPILTKNGTGTWILAGSNTFTGASMNTTNTANGIQINAGVLVAQHSNALGQGATGGSVNNYINNGGTLELSASGIAGSINLNNAITLQLQSGGTIRSAGTNQASSTIKLASGAAVSSTLSAIGASDVFTVGNAANDLSGGAADTVVNIAGSGTVHLGFANDYVGTWAVNSGTLRLGATGALGSLGTVAVAGGTLSSNVAAVTSGAVAVSSGALNINESSVGSLTLAADKSFSMSGGTWSVSIASNSSYDQVIGSGTGTFGLTGGTLALSGISDYSVGYSLFSGFASGSVAGVTISGYDTANWIASLGNNGVLSFASTAVPEPSSFAIIAGLAGVGCVGLRRRRRA